MRTVLHRPASVQRMCYTKETCKFALIITLVLRIVGTPEWVLWQNRKDSDEMQHKTESHQGLNCLL